MTDNPNTAATIATEDNPDVKVADTEAALAEAERKAAIASRMRWMWFISLALLLAFTIWYLRKK